ncbi:MAG: thiamine ABC transporter substrate-binding protein [Treponemataceae bacterium]
MKYYRFYVLFVVVLAMNVTLFAFGARKNSSKTVVVYTYDSFTAEWGMGPKVAKLFEEQTGYKVVFVTCSDGQEILSKAIHEKNKPYADVLLGIDNHLAKQAVQSGVIENYRPKNAKNILVKNLTSQYDEALTPFDWGYFAIIFDTKSKITPPSCLEDLAKPEYKQAVVLMDPRTSTPGMGFFSWTQAVYKEKYLDYWKRIKPSILTMSPNWSTGYGLFTSGEAPLVISYTTSMAYHIQYDKTSRFQALEFSDGHVMQIEYLALVKNAANSKGGKAFIDFMISETAQTLIPEGQWMYPAAEKTALPESFGKVPMPKKTLPYKSDNKDLTELFNQLAK